jgi:uncharacterized protein with PIN domain
MKVSSRRRRIGQAMIIDIEVTTEPSPAPKPKAKRPAAAAVANVLANLDAAACELQRLRTCTQARRAASPGGLGAHVAHLHPLDCLHRAVHLVDAARLALKGA